MKVLGNSWNLSLDDLIASFSNGDNAERDRRVLPNFLAGTEIELAIKPQFTFEDFERSMSPPLLKHFIRRWKPEKRFLRACQSTPSGSTDRIFTSMPTR